MHTFCKEIHTHTHTHYTVCEMECNKLVTVCEVSLCCYMVKSIVKKSSKGASVFCPLGRILRGAFQFVWQDLTSNFPSSVTSDIITCAQCIFMGQS